MKFSKTNVNMALCVIIITAFVVAPNAAKEGDCILLPSEVGPEWYKVPRSMADGSHTELDSEIAYVHMPCAPATLFDISICGCTNLVSFIYRRHGGQKNIETHSKPNLHDIIKVVTPKPVSGSLLINTRTGEVRHCPFRASSRGHQWFLAKEPGDMWRPMKCARGTLFDKRTCTCIHEAVAAREPSKPEDDDIFVIEEEYDKIEKEGTLSQSLGISVKDVDFSKTWNGNNETNRKTYSDRTNDQNWHSADIAEHKSDVLVTLLDRNSKQNKTNHWRTLDLGKDEIAEEHMKLLRKHGDYHIGIKKPIALPLFLDKRMHENVVRNKDSISDTNNEWLSIVNKEKSTIYTNANNHQIVYTGEALINKYQGSSTASSKIEEVITNPDINTTAHADNQTNEDVFYKTECSKKPLPEFGPKFFLMFMDTIGYVPYSCYGNAVYNDTLCSCRPDSGNNLKVDPTLGDDNHNNRTDHETFYISGCSKRPLPELGPQYFSMNLVGLGQVPYACHGSAVYDEALCACRIVSGDVKFDEIDIPVKECNKRAMPMMGQRYFQMFMWRVGFIPYECHAGAIFNEESCSCVTKDLTTLTDVH